MVVLMALDNEMMGFLRRILEAVEGLASDEKARHGVLKEGVASVERKLASGGGGGDAGLAEAMGARRGGGGAQVRRGVRVEGLDLDGLSGPFAGFSAAKDDLGEPVAGVYKLVVPAVYLDEPLDRVVDGEGLEWLVVPTRTAAGKVGLAGVSVDGCSEVFVGTWGDNEGLDLVFCDVWCRVGGGKGGRGTDRPVPVKDEARVRPASEDPF